MTPHVDAPELSDLLEGADHVDVVTADAAVTLREFVARAVNWRPSWLAALYRVRSGFARLLRLDHPDIRLGPRVRPEDLPFEPGGGVAFFTVVRAAEDRHIVFEGVDRHLTAYLAVLAEPLAGGRNRFRLVTIVRYHRAIGRLYFAVIRPFHHAIVHGMARAAARPS